MNQVLKLICLAIYGLAVLALMGTLPANLASVVPLIALGLLLVHAVEAVVAFKHVRRYPGPLWISLVLTLLFGLLHWMPLARRATAQRRG